MLDSLRGWMASKSRRHRRRRRLQAAVAAAAERAQTADDNNDHNHHQDVAAAAAAAPVVMTPVGALGYTPLERASFRGDLNRVTHLIRQYSNNSVGGRQRVAAEINRRNIYGRTALRSAALEGHSEICQVLLQHGAAVHLPDNSGRTPLWYACQYGHTETVQHLLKYGAADAEGDDDDCAIAAACLEAACTAGHEQVVRLLLTKTRRLQEDLGSQQDALCVAALHGHDKVIQVLLQLASPQLDVNQYHHFGFGLIPLTALGCACWYGHAAAVQVLLQHEECCPNQQDGQGRTALHYALEATNSSSSSNNSSADLSHHADDSAVSSLLRLVPRPNKRPRHDQQQQRVQILQLLLNQGADATLVDPLTGQCPLVMACNCNSSNNDSSSGGGSTEESNNNEDEGEEDVDSLNAIYLLLQKGVGDGTLQFQQQQQQRSSSSLPLPKP